VATEVGPPSEVPVSDAREASVTEERSGHPGRGFLVLLSLIQVAWIGALIYGAIRVVDFIQ
jgi:hypothetical protein